MAKDTCPKCGLPEDLCVCETIAKEEQKVEVSTERRTHGRVYTIIKGVESKDIDAEELTKKLKKKLACGGTYKNGAVELQGDHLRRVKDVLSNFGFPKDQIEVEK